MQDVDDYGTHNPCTGSTVTLGPILFRVDGVALAAGYACLVGSDVILHADLPPEHLTRWRAGQTVTVEITGADGRAFGPLAYQVSMGNFFCPRGMPPWISARLNPIQSEAARPHLWPERR